MNNNGNGLVNNSADDAIALGIKEGHVDQIAEGFKRLDPSCLFKNPPKIKWGEKYKLWGHKRKIDYLEKLATSMNHAASLMQDERNKLNDLMILKEKQLINMNESVRKNNEMIQQQITLINEERQSFNIAAADMKARIRELEAKAG